MLTMMALPASRTMAEQEQRNLSLTTGTLIPAHLMAIAVQMQALMRLL